MTRWKIFINGFFFVVGFSAVFILFGTLAGFGGQAFFAYRMWFARIGGFFVILFGLFMMRILKIPILEKTTTVKIPLFFERGKAVNSFILGATFGLGWSPCIGPILGSILTLAAFEGTVFSGAFLLFIFSLGLGLPFLLIAITVGQATMYLKKISRWLNIISFIGGAFLVFLGVLMITDSLHIWTLFFYDYFNFLNYDKILNFL